MAEGQLRAAVLGGILELPSLETSAATTVLTDAYGLVAVDASGGAKNVNLPLGSTLKSGRSYWIRKSETSLNTVTVNRAGADTIEGSTTLVLDDTDRSVILTWTGTTWRPFGQGSTGGGTGGGSHQTWDVFSGISPLTVATYAAENVGIVEQASNSIVISGYTDKAITAGTLTVFVYRTPPGGTRVVAFSMTMTSGNTTSGFYRSSTGITSALVVGDLIDIEVTTDGTFNFTGTGTLQLSVQATYNLPASISGPGSIVVQDEGSTVTGGPHSTLNFVGSSVTATNAGGGVATVTVSGGSSVVIQEEGGTVAGGPHTTLNFIGAGVTATNAGAGVASITVSGTAVIKDEGSTVAGGPHTTLDFVGTGVTATNAGGGTATITVSGGSLAFKDEGSSIAGSPHTSLDFVGGRVQITDLGGNAAQTKTARQYRETLTAQTVTGTDTALTDTLDFVPVSASTGALVIMVLNSALCPAGWYSVSGQTVTWLASSVAPNITTSDTLVAIYETMG